MEDQNKTKKQLAEELIILRTKVAELEKSASEHGLTDEKLEINKHYLTKAQELGGIGTWELDLLKNEIIWTDQNYINFGVPIGTPLTYEIFIGCVHPDDRKYVSTKWTTAVKGKPYDLEHRLIVDGEIRWVREKAEIEIDREGRPIKAIGFTQDITERKKAEEELKQSEELLKQTQEISHVGSWSLDIKNNKLTWSDEVYKIFGINPQEFKASYEAFLESIHPDDKATVDQAYKTAINKKKSYEIAHRILRPNGEVRDVYEKSMDIMDETGKPIRSIGMVQDITEHKKAEEALRQTAVFETLTSVLENFISDSLGNLLTPIYGRIELCEYEDNIDQIKNDLRNVKKGISALITGINAYRKFYKPKDGSLGKIDSVDLRSLLNPLLSGKALKTYQEEEFPIDHNVKLRFVFDPKQEEAISWEKLPSVSGIRTLILTALQETLINAMESYDPLNGGEIMISAKSEDEKMILEISDKGRGMNNEERAKSQLPFYKVLGIKKSARLGLGAYIALEAVKHQGGELQIESKEGVGTTASIILNVSQ